MKKDYKKPELTVSLIELNNLMALTGSNGDGDSFGAGGGTGSGGVSGGQGKYRGDDYIDDKNGWKDGLW